MSFFKHFVFVNFVIPCQNELDIASANVRIPQAIISLHISPERTWYFFSKRGIFSIFNFYRETFYYFIRKYWKFGFAKIRIDSHFL